MSDLPGTLEHLVGKYVHVNKRDRMLVFKAGRVVLADSDGVLIQTCGDIQQCIFIPMALIDTILEVDDD